MQLVLTKLHLGEQLLARVSAAKHCDHTLGTGQQHRKLSMLQLTVEVYESSGRSKLGQKNVRSLQLNQLQLHIRGGVAIEKVKRSADDLELLRMRTYISEAREENSFRKVDKTLTHSSVSTRTTSHCPR